MLSSCGKTGTTWQQFIQELLQQDSEEASEEMMSEPQKCGLGLIGVSSTLRNIWNIPYDLT